MAVAAIDDQIEILAEIDHAGGRGARHHLVVVQHNGHDLRYVEEARRVDGATILEPEIVYPFEWAREPVGQAIVTLEDRRQRQRIFQVVEPAAAAARFSTRDQTN